MIRRLRQRRARAAAERVETVLHDRVLREAMQVWAGDWSPRGTGGRPRPRGRRTA